jgi:hypothetical protein
MGELYSRILVASPEKKTLKRYVKKRTYWIDKDDRDTVVVAALQPDCTELHARGTT